MMKMKRTTIRFSLVLERPEYGISKGNEKLSLNDMSRASKPSTMRLIT